MSTKQGSSSSSSGSGGNVNNLVVTSFINSDNLAKLEEGNEIVEIARGCDFQDVSKSKLAEIAGRLGSTMEAKAEGIGSPCQGVINKGYLGVDQVMTNGLIIMVDSMEQRSNRTSSESNQYSKSSPYLRGFAVCKFKQQKDGNLYLYIDVICANDPSRLGVANALWKKIFEVTGALKDAGLINGIQLSSLTYVIAYYYKKLGFKFYNIDSSGDSSLDTETNNAAAELSKWRFNDDDKNQLLIIQQADETWYEYALRLADLDDETSGGFIDLRDRSELNKLLGFLNELQMEKDRKKTLVKRYATSLRITNLLSKINSKGKDYEETSPTIQFMEIANSNGHSVEAPQGVRAPASKRGAEGAEDYEDALDRLDPGGQGWTMFLLGEDFDKLRNIYRGGGRRKTRRRNKSRKKSRKKQKRKSKKGGNKISNMYKNRVDKQELKKQNEYYHQMKTARLQRDTERQNKVK